MKRLFICLLIPALLTACSDNNEDNPYDPIPQVDMVDMPDEPDMTDMPVDIDVCQPQTQCPAGTCGQIDDGCGGTLDCGEAITTCPVGVCGQVDDGCGGTLDCGVPKTCDQLGCGTHDDGCGAQIDCGACLCDGGQPVDVSCGPCGLGSTQCDAGSNDGTCSVQSIPVLDGFDAQGCTDRLLFVDASAMLGGDGTKAKPHRLYANALTKAGFGDVIIIANNSTLREPLDIKDGVSVLGGYNRNGEIWTYTGVASNVEVDATGRNIAIDARDITNPTYIKDLNVRGADRTDHQNAVGLWAERAGSLIIERTNIHSGHAGNGVVGEDGIDGIRGVNGDNGKTGDVGNHNRFARNNTRPAGGNGGLNAACIGAAGGNGASSPGLVGNTWVSENGGSANNPFGGFEGAGGQTPNVILTYPNSSTLTPTSGAHGYTGTIGAVGVNGMPGFRFENGQIVIEGDGTSGADGGHGGGGGGGGAHARVKYYNLDVAYDNNPAELWSWPPSGAGGGSGGCGGTGGKGGQAGRGAFGAVIIDGNPTLIDVLITGGVGGDGAKGGFGGQGSPGGLGGIGATTFKAYDGIVGGPDGNGVRPGDGTGIIEINVYLSSGHGGNGGAGADGGNGGHGTGGPTVGLWCVNAKPVMERAAARSSSPGMGHNGARSGKIVDAQGCQ